MSLRLGCAADAFSRRAGAGGQEGCLMLGASREATAEAFAGSERAGADSDGGAAAVLTMCWQLAFSLVRSPCFLSSLRPFLKTFGSECRVFCRSFQPSFSLSLTETLRQTR
jgi:hypothetical protein